MAIKYTISRSFILETAKELASQGVKVHRGLRSLDVRELKNQFSNLVSLAREDWQEQTGQSSLPDEQYNLLRKSFAEQLVTASNLKPNSQDDWNNILLKAAEDYDIRSDAIKAERLTKQSISNIENSDIYFDIINSISSKAAALENDQSRFKSIKYTYVSEGTGDLDESRFRELLSDDDLFALSRLSETYSGDRGFTSDPLYEEIKQRAVNRGLELIGHQTINTVPSVPSGPTFNFDF